MFNYQYSIVVPVHTTTTITVVPGTGSPSAIT